jgi:hypothetical protein
MRKVIASIVSVAALVAVISGVAFAQTYPAQTPPATQPATQPAQPSQPGSGQNVSPGQVPTVANLKPFSAEADYMSLAGYLRYLMHQASGQWVTYAEATRVVKQQGAQ